jgi:hypothetical protein
MADIDEFANSLLEEAKRFFEKAQAESTAAGQSAYLHAALYLAFCSLEAHVNAIAEELASHAEFSSPHEQAILLEQEVRLEDGEFRARGFKMYRLEDRMLFLCRRVAGSPLDRSAAWWGELSMATNLRNKLTHPKDPPQITVDSVRRAVEAVITAIDVVYKHVYGLGLPVAGRGLQSKMSF